MTPRRQYGDVLCSSCFLLLFHIWEYGYFGLPLYRHRVEFLSYVKLGGKKKRVNISIWVNCPFKSGFCLWLQEVLKGSDSGRWAGTSELHAVITVGQRMRLIIRPNVLLWGRGGGLGEAVGERSEGLVGGCKQIAAQSDWLNPANETTRTATHQHSRAHNGTRRVKEK